MNRGLEMPEFSYFLSPSGGPVTAGCQTWHAPLPQRRPRTNGVVFPSEGKAFSYGDYFSVARAYLEGGSFRLLRCAISRCIGQRVGTTDLSKIRIYAEKHGAFYHPARIVADLGQLAVSFVLNVAISGAGRRCFADEYRHLEQLTRTYPNGFLPQVYGLGEMERENIGRIGMFLGEWFEGYHEFHLSLGQGNSTTRTELWDGAPTRSYLTRHQARVLYRQMGRILTSYYNPETFEQITAWHQAAGDFIARIEGRRITAKLVTVRRYESVLKGREEPGSVGSRTETILHALLLFLIGLSIKVRLDRSDGVGSMLWADDDAVHGVLAGFFDALAAKPELPDLPAPLETCFRYYLTSLTHEDLLDLSQAVVSGWAPANPDTPVILGNLERHVGVLYGGLRRSVSEAG